MKLKIKNFYNKLFGYSSAFIIATIFIVGTTLAIKMDQNRIYENNDQIKCKNFKTFHAKGMEPFKFQYMKENPRYWYFFDCDWKLIKIIDRTQFRQEHKNTRNS